MQVQLKPGVIVLAPESSAETAALAAWKAEHRDVVFAMAENRGSGASLIALGPRPQACREPLNVHSSSDDPQLRLIANFAPTPFVLDGMRYASVESFWQSLRFAPERRAEIAAMDGRAAKRASYAQPYGPYVRYMDREIAVGTHAHWELMRRACQAKFEQNEDARAALLATGERPLIHRVRRDSRTIPGVIMAEIWMALRASLRAAEAGRGDAAPP